MKDMTSNNCRVLSTTDDSHVSKVTPLQTKRKEMAEANARTEPQEMAQIRETAAKRRR